MNVLELSEQEIIRRNSLNEMRAMGIDYGHRPVSCSRVCNKRIFY